MSTSTSILGSITRAISASASVIDSSAEALDVVVKDLPKGVTRVSSTLGKSLNQLDNLLELTDLTTTNWVKGKKASNLQDSITRRLELGKLFEEVKNNPKLEGVFDTSSLDAFIASVRDTDY